MHILAPSFLEPLKDARVPVINLHPAIYGEYDGADSIRRAYDDFQQREMDGMLLEGRNYTRTGVMVLCCVCVLCAVLCVLCCAAVACT